MVVDVIQLSACIGGEVPGITPMSGDRNHYRLVEVKFEFQGNERGDEKMCLSLSQVGL